jgi:2-oxoglutarate dehydrogenase E2 component (dihydrolipoamide succinyltransferase)
MKYDVVVPAVGESISEVTIAQIFFKVGDSVKKEDELVELETEKVNVSVAAPADGVIESININVGDTINVGSLILTMSDEISQSSKPAESSKTEQAPQKSESKEEKKPENNSNQNAKASPAASRMAGEQGVDLKNISGTGRDGMVIKPDVVNQSGNQSNNQERQGVPPTSVSISRGSNSQNVISQSIEYPEETNVVRMSSLRRTIAKRLKEAQNTSAILTTFNEVDMSVVMEMRKRNQDDFQKKHGVKLGFMSFFIKAATLALQEIPAVNAQIEGDNIKYNNFCNISVAIGTEKGLVVPVIRHCDKMSFDQIEKEIINYAGKANKGTLTPNDFVGGTFTISNGGTYGSMMSTPIINPPQSAILGMHSITERAVVVNGQIVIRPMMYLALSYDHRLIDGKEAVTFLVKIKNYIENPQRMLLSC